MTRPFLVAALVLAACGTDEPPPEPGTWYGEIGTIVRTKCAGCHNEGGVAPFSLETYGDAYEQMGRMVEAIDEGIMPPWYANDPEDCTPRHRWKDDARLSTAERDAIHAWVAAGGPEGTKRELPAIRSTSLENPTHTVTGTEFVSTGTRDQFVCFLYDPGIDATRWITGSQVYPTALDLVHHVNVYLIGPNGVPGAMEYTGGLGVAKVGCDHPPGVAIQSWLPGNPALLLPPKVGIPVGAGTHVLIQVHYHPAGVGGSDATSLALRLTDQIPEWRFDLGVYGNSPGAPNLQPGDGDLPDGTPVFMIPANSTDHVEHMVMSHKLEINPYRVLSVTPHMHLLGTHQRATLTHSDGSTECLIDSGWDFDWQRTYTYDADLEDLPVFDGLSKVNLSCRWDNSFTNPEMPRLLADTGRVAPYDVSLGFTTADEMCLADFGLLTRY